MLCVCAFVSAVYHLTDRTAAKIIPLQVTISRWVLHPNRRLILPRSGQEPSSSRFLLLSHGEVGYADFLNCSNRSASRSRSGRSSPRLGISNRSREYKNTRKPRSGGTPGFPKRTIQRLGGGIVLVKSNSVGDRPREALLGFGDQGPGTVFHHISVW